MNTQGSRLTGKVAIVTGAARGLGAAFVRAFVAEGASVVAADVREAEVRALAAELGAQALGIRHDVARAEDWARLIEATEARFGALTTLVNNAGIVHQGPLERLAEEDYRRVIDVNQVGVFLGMRAVVPAMRRAGGGSIVNVSSTAGLIAFPGILGYVASKWAVRGMSKAAAQELAADRIRVNSVHPGFVATPINPMPEDSPAIRAQPIPRMARPEEIAPLVVFLSCDESSYCTGAEFVADGGYTTL